MATLASLVVKLVGDVSGFNSSMDEASARLRSAGQSMTSAGAGLTAGVTLPLVGIGVAALHTAGEFEQSMNMMAAVSDATAGEMAQVSSTAIALGADLTLPGTSASDAALAMVELSRAGLSVQESMDAARGVLQLSAAAQIGNAQAAEITANALNTFGLAGTDATRVANLLAGGANASSAEITDMAAAIQMSGSVAASMGVPIQDLTTAIALMANAGISGSDAGTSLKTMLMRLGAPTNEAAALMRDLGVSVFDASGTMLPMEQIIGQFSGALGGMTMEQRNAALATLFGADAIRAANVVLMGGTDAFNAMATAVTAEGQAQALAAAQTSGFQGSLDGLRSTVETVLLTVGTPFLTMLTGWVQWLASIVGRLAELDPRMLNLIVVIGLAAAAIGPLLMVLGSMTTGLGVAAGAVAFLLSPIGLVIIAVGLLAAAVVEHFGGVQATIEAASTFVQGVLQTLSTFVSANQAEIMGWVDQAWTRIESIVTNLVNGVERVVSAVLGVVATFINTHGAQIEGFVRRAWEQIGTIVNLALELIDEIVTRVLNGIARFINEHGDEIQRILEVAWNLIQGIIQTALDLIEGVIRVALALIRGDWDEAWELVKQTAETLWDDIQFVIETALDALWELVQRIGGEIKDFLVETWQTIRNKAVEAFAELKDRVLGVLGDLASGMYERGAGMVRAFADGVRNTLQAALDAARELVRQIRELLPGSDAKTGPLSDLTASGSALPATLAVGISRGAPVAVSAVQGLAGQVMGVLSGMALSAAEKTEQMLGGMVGSIERGKPEVANALGGMFGGMAEQVTTWAGGGVGAADEYLGTMYQTIVRGAPEVANAIGGMISGASEYIARGAPEVANQIAGMIGGMVGSIERGKPEVANALAGVVSGMVDIIERGKPELANALGGLGGGEKLDGGPGTKPWGAGQAGGVRDETRAITINLNGPWHVSNEMDAKRIAEIVGEVLAGKAVTNKRLAVGWAGI